MIFTKLINKWRSLRYYVIADPSDNSVTLSRHLFYHMKKCAESSGVDGASVFVFRIPQGGTFGFMLSPEISEPTQLCQIQYNGKYRCVPLSGASSLNMACLRSVLSNCPFLFGRHRRARPTTSLIYRHVKPFAYAEHTRKHTQDGHNLSL